MLTDAELESILETIPRLKIGVIGDLFLDRYLDIDGALTEPSLETGLDAYQVVGVRSQPGAAGTVINNLAAFGVGQIIPIGFIGDDGEGHELWKALGVLPGLEEHWIVADVRRRTPTYTKPILHQTGKPARELNRLDIKNRQPIPEDLEEKILQGLHDVWEAVDALLVIDQVSEPECGVVTSRVRARLEQLGGAFPDKLILTDSRRRIGKFRRVTLKPNRQECIEAIGGSASNDTSLDEAARMLASQSGRAVICTLGEEGMLLVQPGQGELIRISAYPVQGEIDVVGAGDSSSAAIACAIAGGASLPKAAEFGSLVASITIQKIGTTGTATPTEIRQRRQEVSKNEKPPD